MQKDSKIFVAGGTGLVGSAIIRKLQENGFGNILSNYHNRIPHTVQSNQIKYFKLDLTNQSDIDTFMKNERPEYIFLSAAKVGGILANNTYKAEFIYQNIMIASNVIYASYKYGVKKLLNLGSSCIYPKYATQPMKEEYLLTGELEPTNEPYAIAKIAAIKLCRYFNEQYGMNFISVMPTNLYGAGDNFDLVNSHVLPALIRKFHLGKLLSEQKYDAIKNDFLIYGNNELDIDSSKIIIHNNSSNKDIIKILSHFGITRTSVAEKFVTTIDLWGTGKPYREFLYVDDLAESVIYLMNKYDYSEIGEFVNIGTGIDITIKELAYMVKDIVEFEGEIQFDHAKPDGTPKKLLDISLLSKLGWKAKTSLKDGIKRTYSWYQNSGK